MTEALSRGNLNQVGRSAWESMIDLIQEMVVDEINDAIVECDDETADTLNTRLQELQTDIENYRDDNGLGPNDSDRTLVQNNEDYAQMKKG